MCFGMPKPLSKERLGSLEPQSPRNGNEPQSCSELSLGALKERKFSCWERALFPSNRDFLEHGAVPRMSCPQSHLWEDWSCSPLLLLMFSGCSEWQNLPRAWPDVLPLFKLSASPASA